MMTTTEPLLLRSEVKKEESDLHHHHHMCGMEDCSPADSSLYSPTTTGLQLEVIYIRCSLASFVLLLAKYELSESFWVRDFQSGI